MEEETIATSVVPVTKAIEETEAITPTNKNGNKEEEASLDGEFIKIEKETIKVHDSGSHTSPSKVTELELELEKLTTILKHTESKNAELEANNKKLQDRFKETEDTYNSQINTFQENNQTNLVKVNVELETSRKKMYDLEQELDVSTSESKRFEDLHKKSGSLAESETKRALEFERLLQLAQASAKEMENQMILVQEELTGLYDKIVGHEKVKEAFEKTTVDLFVIQEELEVSKSQVLEFKRKYDAHEAQISELTEELNLKKSSHKEELQAKEFELEEVKLKLHELTLIQEQLIKSTTENEALDAVVFNLKSELSQIKDRCSELEEGSRIHSHEISSLMEENNMLNETHENAKKDFQTVITNLEDQVKKYASNETSLKSELENLKAEIQENVELKNNLKNLEEKLAAAQTTIVDQVTENNSNESKSRDIGSTLTTPSKRKSKKNIEPSSSSNTQIQSTNDSFGTSFKFVMGVALVSVIIGIVLGKRY